MEGSEVVSAGCDYITVTTSTHDGGFALATWASSLSRVALDRGFLRQGWGMAGFSGFSYGQLQIGRRGDECMLRLSSDLARECWRKAYALSENVSRFDLQFTHREKRDPHFRIKKYYRQALKHSKSRKNGPIVTFITGSRGADTLYLGNRQSDWYGRIYNKHAQSKLSFYQGCVRFEVEFHNRLARSVAKACYNAKHDSTAAIAGVNQFITNRMVQSPIKSNHLLSIEISPKRGTLDDRLDWLRVQARGSCQQIVLAGRGRELLKSLGLCMSGNTLRCCLPTHGECWPTQKGTQDDANL